jgi:hypothetical protein
MQKILFRQPILKANGTFLGWRYWGMVDCLGSAGIKNTLWGDAEAPTRLRPYDTRNKSQQFTGKHDKYGDKIYVGDFLKISNSEIVLVVFDEQTGNFDSNPRISYAEWGWDETMIDHTGRIEVIGNIIENPELEYELGIIPPKTKAKSKVKIKK